MRCRVLTAFILVATYSFPSGLAVTVNNPAAPKGKDKPINTAKGVAPPPSSKSGPTVPLVYALVSSARTNLGRRNALRRTLELVRTQVRARIRLRFAVCNITGQTQAGDKEDIYKEARLHNDIVLLNCQESANRSHFTRKTILGLKAAYKDPFFALKEVNTSSDGPRETTFLLKMHDDTFVSWHRLSSFLTAYGKFAYLGAHVKAGHFVNRDPSSPWYQPEDTFPNKSYPAYMEAIPGYLLGSGLVKKILEAGVAEKNVLTNEDQSVGVWLELIRKSGVPVRYVPMPTTDDAKFEHSEGVERQRPSTWGAHRSLLHHRLKGDVMHCLASADAAENDDEPIDGCFKDSIFAALFSHRSSAEHRTHARAMLRTVMNHTNASHLRAKFTICNRSVPADTIQPALKREAVQFGDIVFLDCEDNSEKGTTVKLLKALEHYHKHHQSYSHFMKISDTTFVAWKRLWRALDAEFDSERGYLGVPVKTKQLVVDRNPQSEFYQPVDGYAEVKYPEHMEAAPGYILGRELVSGVLSRGIAKSNIIQKEDAAVGVWVNALKKIGQPVVLTSLSGGNWNSTNGGCYRKWQDYNYVLHSGAGHETMQCLQPVAEADDPETEIDGCFADCIHRTMNTLQKSLDDLMIAVQRTGQGMRTIESELHDVHRGITWLGRQPLEEASIGEAAVP